MREESNLTRLGRIDEYDGESGGIGIGTGCPKQKQRKGMA
jgi:hypothetical protein